MKLTSAEFKAQIERNPAWAATLTEPVEITDFCNMNGEPITHLSPLLHFTGTHDNGRTAAFSNCPDLKVAEGVFDGFVHFTNSGILKIGDLKINRPNKDGHAASFWECAHLKIAEGTYPGSVDFQDSGIEKIGRLVVTATDNASHAANFSHCKELKIAEGTYPGFVDFSHSGIKAVGRLIIQSNPTETKADFSGCNIRLQTEFLGPEFEMDETTRRTNLARLAATKAAKTAPELDI